MLRGAGVSGHLEAGNRGVCDSGGDSGVVHGTGSGAGESEFDPDDVSFTAAEGSGGGEASDGGGIAGGDGVGTGRGSPAAEETAETGFEGAASRGKRRRHANCGWVGVGRTC